MTRAKFNKELKIQVVKQVLEEGKMNRNEP